MAAKRRRLIERRKNLGFTQESLAAALRVDRTTVERWENGRREPQPWIRPRLASAMKLSAQHLDHLLDQRDRAEIAETDDMQRRELLRLFSMVGTALTMPGVAAPTLPAHTDHTRQGDELWRIYSLASSKAEVMPLVRRQLTVLSDALAHSQSPETHRKLCEMAAELFQLAGEISFDTNTYTDAAHCYTLAAQASKDARAYDLWACAMTRHAYLSVYERQFADAIPMLDLAAALAKRGDSSLSTRHWVAAVQAEAYAGIGDLDACQRALDTAEQVRDLPDPVHNGGWLRFDGTRLAEERGTCYTRLGRIDLAETALTEALQEATSPRRRANVLIDLAMIGAHRRDPDEVVTYADVVLSEARRSGSGVISRKLLELQHRLPPMRDNPQIQRISADITALANTNS